MKKESTQQLVTIPDSHSGEPTHNNRLEIKDTKLTLEASPKLCHEDLEEGWTAPSKSSSDKDLELQEVKIYQPRKLISKKPAPLAGLNRASPLFSESGSTPLGGLNLDLRDLKDIRIEPKKNHARKSKPATIRLKSN